MTTLTKAICIGLSAAASAFLIAYWWGNNSPRWELERRLSAGSPGASVRVFTCGVAGEGWPVACWSTFAVYVLFFTLSFLLLSAQEDLQAERRREFMNRTGGGYKPPNKAVHSNPESASGSVTSRRWANT